MENEGLNLLGINKSFLEGNEVAIFAVKNSK